MVAVLENHVCGTISVSGWNSGTATSTQNPSYDYQAFGEAYNGNTTATNTDMGTVTTIDNRYTYTGREKNPVSGTMYYRYRAYNPMSGRFIHRDPAGYPNNAWGNLYDYVYGMPVNYYDVYGLGKWTVPNNGNPTFYYESTNGGSGTGATALSGIIDNLKTTAEQNAQENAEKHLKDNQKAYDSACLGECKKREDVKGWTIDSCNAVSIKIPKGNKDNTKITRGLAAGNNRHVAFRRSGVNWIEERIERTEWIKIEMTFDHAFVQCKCNLSKTETSVSPSKDVCKNTSYKTLSMKTTTTIDFEITALSKYTGVIKDTIFTKITYWHKKANWEKTQKARVVKGLSPIPVMDI